MAIDDKPGKWYPNWFTKLTDRMLPVLFANWITSAGTMLAIIALVLLALAFFMNIYSILAERETNPYFGLVSFMVLPGMLVAGLVLIFVGFQVRKHQDRKHGRTPRAVEIRGEAFRRKTFIFIGVTFLALVLFASFSYEAYHFTDSTQFCGLVCHEVMEPEYNTYLSSPHANVNCVSCHIGPGASWFVRSKLSGVRQVFAVLGNTYSRPIPVPVHDLRPARETCEVCHWPAKFHGSQLVVREHFEPDRDNSPSVSAVVMKVGGVFHSGRQATGIHWHVDPRNEVRYRTLDEKRQEIVEVVQNSPEGEIRYLREGADPDTTLGVWRVMDCLDCHNRPSHIYQSPDGALDLAFSEGELDRDIPFLRLEAERVIRDLDPSSDTADSIAARLLAIYQAEHPEDLELLEDGLEQNSVTLAKILERNVYPQMNIAWGTYRSNVGHFDDDGEFAETGCFRCHTDEHVSEDGRYISQDCDNCHALLAEREEDLDSLPDFVMDFLTQQ